MRPTTRHYSLLRKSFKRLRGRGGGAVLLLVASLVTAPAATGQSRDPDTGVKFNLSPPGARSLALGGAFVGLAEDATSAYTNPAGLTNLTVGGSEVAVEVRNQQFKNSFVSRGHFSSVPGIDPIVTQRGVDVVGPGLERAEASSETTGLSFLSFAYVLPKGLTMALYRHELGNFSTSFETQGPFVDALLIRPGVFCENRIDCPVLQPFRYGPRRSATELEIVNYGLSGAYEFELPLMGDVESELSVGLGISYYDAEILVLDEFFTFNRFSLGFPPQQFQAGGFFGPPDFGPANLSFDNRDVGEDHDIGINLGFLWKIGKDQRWSVGAVLRQGAEFETTTVARFCTGGVRRDIAGNIVPDADGNPVIDPRQCTPLPASGGRFTVPEVYGLGVAFRSTEDRWKVALDINRVRYSQRLSDFTTGLDSVPADQFTPGSQELSIEDADQVHLGFERIVLVYETLFVGTARFGAWHEPFHELEYSGTSEFVGAFLRRPRDDEIHFSFGFGLAIKEDYQIDFAADLSDPTNTFSVSLVRFL